MSDELIEPFAVNDVFVDGFGDFYIADGVLRCVGYRLKPRKNKSAEPLKVAVMQIQMTMSSAVNTLEQAQRAMSDISIQRSPLKKMLS